MKKVLIGFMAIMMSLALVACATAPQAEPSNESEAPAESTEQPAGETGAESEPVAADATEELTKILMDLAVNYAPGTAGSSLSATKFAGELLDWNAKNGLSADEIKNLVATLYASFDGETATAFVSEKISAIYEAAKSLTADDAKELLESAGYKAESFPWASEDITALFTSIYQGIGQELPQ